VASCAADSLLDELISDHRGFVREVLDERRRALTPWYSFDRWGIHSPEFSADFAHHVDYGERAQGFDIENPEASVEVTRCSSVALALSLIYCGLNKTESALSDGGHLLDLRRLTALVEAHATNPSALARLVLHASVGGAVESDPPQGHVLVIVFQPDGRFLWLQSYISHYSLFDWLKHMKTSGAQRCVY